MMGLRLRDGVEEAALALLFGEDPEDRRRADRLDGHLRAGLLERAEGKLRLTTGGLLLADSVIADLI